MPKKPLIKTPKRGFSVVNIDASPAQQDWIKRGVWDGPTDLIGFWHMLGLRVDSTKAEKRKAVRKMRHLPVFARIPAGIKSALVKQGII